MSTAQRKAVLLIATLLAQLLLVPAAQAGERPVVWFPTGPGSEGSVFTRATTNDPFELRTSGPTGIEWARVTVNPGGTTGLVPRWGITVVMVVEGAATIISVAAGNCSSRAVHQGFAIIERGDGAAEIRNDGQAPLELFTISFTPGGPSSGPVPAAFCAPAKPARSATVASLLRAVIEGPLSVESTGLSDIYVGGVRLAPQGRLAWHVQHRPLFGGVGEGHVTLDLAPGQACQTGVYPVKTGFLEPAGMVHALRNETSSPAMYYYVAFAQTPVPFLAPSPPPGQCAGE